MLQSRNLDDQTFEEIMELAMGRLAWLCPAWTDYNAHDPGITVLELMAWYKEMQQYHLNTVTDGLRKKLLKLVGVHPAPPRPARLMISMPSDAAETYPALTRLEDAQEIPFELTQAVTAGASVDGIFIAGESGAYDALGALLQGGIAVWPFGDGDGEDTQLLIRLSGASGTTRLYFETDDVSRVERNPYTGPAQAPRTLEWSLAGGDVLEVADETHALSVSGFVTLELPEVPPESDGGEALPAGVYIRVRETEHGCEERARIKAVDAARFEAVQRETLARLSAYTVDSGECTVALTDAVSLSGSTLVFIRKNGYLSPVDARTSLDESGARVTFDASGCDADGRENAFLIGLDPIRGEELIFSSSGLPGMCVELPLCGRRALTQGMTLICDTLCEDGEIRPAFWHYTEDISVAGPRERVFGFDAAREQFVFGDGEHGMRVPRGERAILAANLALSFCSGGNVPEGDSLRFPDGVAVKSTAASGGSDGQSVDAAAKEFLRKFSNTKKCASAQDYEAAARATPGLRVAAAKAIPMFDPAEPGGRTRIPTVTVVVVPGSGRARPMPDANFLERVQEKLDSVRPICTLVKATAPLYVPVSVTAQLRAQRGAENAARDAIEAYFAVDGKRNIGDHVIRDDILSLLSGIEGVIKIDRLELRSLGQGCTATARGDLALRCNAVAYPAQIRVLIK